MGDVPSSRRTFGVAPFVCATFALGLLWALATPVMGVPDEPAHVVRAASLVRGQLVGTPRTGPAGDRVYFARVPETLAWPKVPCFAHHDSTTPACDVAPRGRGDVLVEVESVAARYNPGYYALVGLPTLVAPGRTTVYLMRLVTAAMVAGLLGLAAVAVREAAAPRWAVVGLAAAVTPMELFLAGSVNPSAVEIAAGLALWATLLGWFSRPDPLLDRSYAVRAAIAATALVLSRSLGPLFLALILGGAMLMAPKVGVVRLLRARWAPAVAVGGATLAALAWTLVVGALETSPGDYQEYRSLRRYLYSMFLSLDDFERQMIGVLGWLDTPLQSHVYVVWFAILGFLVLAALAVGGARERVLLLGLVALSVVVPIVVQWPAAPELGLIWQGRYLLPLMVGLPLAAGWVLASSEAWTAVMRGAWPVWLPLGTLAALQLASYWWALHRNVIGLSKDWIGFEPLWQPPLGWIPLTLAYASVVAWWTWALARVGRPVANRSAGGEDVIRLSRTDSGRASEARAARRAP